MIDTTMPGDHQRRGGDINVIGRFTAVVLALIALTASPLRAAVVVITYTGVVAYGTDNTGVFGMAGADLTGAAFIASYTLDTGKPGITHDETPPTYSSYRGVQNLSALSGVFTVNGITRNVAGTDFSATSQEAYSTFSSVNAGVRDVTDAPGPANTFASIYNYVGSTSPFLSRADFAKPFSYAVRPGDYNEGLAGFFSRDGEGNDVENASLGLTNRMVTLTLAPVPEPSTWALTIIGFGVIGAMLRRRFRHRPDIDEKQCDFGLLGGDHRNYISLIGMAAGGVSASS